MSLSCECDGDYDWYLGNATETTAKINCECSDCGAPIKKGDFLETFDEITQTEDGGEDVIPNHWNHCETCSDIQTSLSELGYCLTYDRGAAKENLRQYHEMTLTAKQYKARYG